MDPYVGRHLNWRPMTVADLPELDALREQIQVLDDPVLDSVDRLVHTDDVARLETGSIGGWDDYGSLLAYGWNVVTPHTEVPQVHLLGGVHPTHRYMGIGRAVLDWQLARALEWRDDTHPGLPVWIGCYVDHGQPGIAVLLNRLGFSEERYFFDMHRPLHAIPAASEVEGIRLVRFEEAHAQQLLDLHNLCFRDDLGTRTVAPASWYEWLGRDGFRPGWSWVALSHGVPVGYTLSGLDEEAEDGVVAGWTDRVGVHPEFRGRGIALALLQRTLGAMAEDGCAIAGIGVDTTDPASPARLEELLGYRQHDGLVLMSKVVQPGDD